MSKIFKYIHILKTFLGVFCCVPLSIIDNGRINYSTPLTQEGYSFDTLAELHSDPGYKQSTSSQGPKRCEQSGEWNRQTQTCIASNETKIFFFN